MNVLGFNLYDVVVCDGVIGKWEGGKVMLQIIKFQVGFLQISDQKIVIEESTVFCEYF